MPIETIKDRDAAAIEALSRIARKAAGPHANAKQRRRALLQTFAMAHVALTGSMPSEAASAALIRGERL